MKRRRRCGEERWDFTEKDDPVIFPIYITKGGELYGFCPAKATWDASFVTLYRLLLISAETGAMLRPGALEDQPDWYIDLLGWILPRLDSFKFITKASMILGSGDSKKKTPSQGAVKTSAGRQARGGNNR